MPVSALTLVLPAILLSAPLEQPPERSDIEPDRFRLRTGSLEIGAAWRPELYLPVCGENPLCGFTPRLGFDLELGSRAVRLLTGVYTAPVPTFSVDLASIEAFMVEVGVLFGGPRIRAGLALDHGAINVGGALVLRLSPWVDQRGHRHGLDLRVTTSIFQPLGVGISYRWYPRKLERKSR